MRRRYRRLHEAERRSNPAEEIARLRAEWAETAERECVLEREAERVWEPWFQEMAKQERSMPERRDVGVKDYTRVFVVFKGEGNEQEDHNDNFHGFLPAVWGKIAPLLVPYEHVVLVSAPKPGLTDPLPFLWVELDYDIRRVLNWRLRRVVVFNPPSPAGFFTVPVELLWAARQNIPFKWNGNQWNF